jgi:vacuolar protein sorting-associated protein 13A/C
VIVLSLGKLIIQTEPRALADESVRMMHEKGANADEILAELISQSYDKFQLEIQDIQVLVANADEDWEEAINMSRGSEMHILEPTFVKLSAQLSVITDDPRLPKCKVACELPSINISVTEDRVLELLSIITTLPLPESDEIVEQKPLARESNLLGSSLSLLKYLDEKQQMLTKKSEGSAENAQDATDGTVVQFTELEAYFILNEISITICKPSKSGASSSEEFATPIEDFSPVAETSVNLPTPSFKSVGFDIPSSSPVHAKMLSIKIKQLEMKMAQKTYELNVTLKLGAISFDQYRWRNEKEKLLNVINTPRYDKHLDYLFTLEYTNCKKISPEFITKYASVEQLIEIKISTVVLQLNQDGITELIQIASDLQSRVDTVMSASPKQKPDEMKDRFGNIHTETTASKILDKLPIILEEGATSSPDVGPSKC